MKTKKSKVIALLHEVVGAKHRIVRVAAETTETGPWAELYELAELNGLLANTGEVKRLPKGIFRVSAAQQQVLA